MQHSPRLEAERGRFSLLRPVAMGPAILALCPWNRSLWVGPSGLASACSRLSSPPGTIRICASPPPSRSGRLKLRLCPRRVAHRRPTAADQHPVRSCSASRAPSRGLTCCPAHAALPFNPPHRAHSARRRLPWRHSPALALGGGRHHRPHRGRGRQRLLSSTPSPPDRPAYPGGWDRRVAGIPISWASPPPALPWVMSRTIAPAPHTRAHHWLRTCAPGIAHADTALLPVSTASIAVTLLTGDEQAIPTTEHSNFISVCWRIFWRWRASTLALSWGCSLPPLVTCFRDPAAPGTTFLPAGHTHRRRDRPPLPRLCRAYRRASGPSCAASPWPRWSRLASSSGGAPSPFAASPSPPWCSRQPHRKLTPSTASGVASMSTMAAMARPRKEMARRPTMTPSVTSEAMARLRRIGRCAPVSAA